MPRNMLWRNKADFARDFAARKVLTINGVTYQPGQIIDTAGIGRRRIRLLFDQRKIRFADEQDTATELTTEAGFYDTPETAKSPQASPEIPVDWKKLKAPELKALANSLTGETYATSAAASAAIEQELVKRGSA